MVYVCVCGGGGGEGGGRGSHSEMSQMFSVHTTPEEFENAPISGQFGFVFRKTPAGKSRD